MIAQLDYYYFFAQWPPLLALAVWFWLESTDKRVVAKYTQEFRMSNSTTASRSDVFGALFVAVMVALCLGVSSAEVLAWRQEQGWRMNLKAVGHMLGAASWAMVAVYHLVLHRRRQLPSIGMGLFIAMDFLSVAAVGISYTIDFIEHSEHEWWMVRFSASALLGLIHFRYVLLLIFLAVVAVLLIVLVLPWHLFTILYRTCCQRRAYEADEELYGCQVHSIYDAPAMERLCGREAPANALSASDEELVHVHLVAYELWASWLPVYSLGLGAYHSALEIGAEEWCFECPDGLVARPLGTQPDYCLGNLSRRRRVYLGTVTKSSAENMLLEASKITDGEDYGIVTFNCHHVVTYMWSKLSGSSAAIPSWVLRLHELVLFFFPRSKVRQIERILLQQELDYKRSSSSLGRPRLSRQSSLQTNERRTMELAPDMEEVDVEPNALESSLLTVPNVHDWYPNAPPGAPSVPTYSDNIGSSDLS